MESERRKQPALEAFDFSMSSTGPGNKGVANVLSEWAKMSTMPSHGTFP